jgi:hypothetical protein
MGISLGYGFVLNPDFCPVLAGELARTESCATLQAAIAFFPPLTRSLSAPPESPQFHP